MLSRAYFDLRSWRERFHFLLLTEDHCNNSEYENQFQEEDVHIEEPVRGAHARIGT